MYLFIFTQSWQLKKYKRVDKVCNNEFNSEVLVNSNINGVVVNSNGVVNGVVVDIEKKHSNKQQDLNKDLPNLYIGKNGQNKNKNFSAKYFLYHSVYRNTWNWFYPFAISISSKNSQATQEKISISSQELTLGSINWLNITLRFSLKEKITFWPYNNVF